MRGFNCDAVVHRKSVDEVMPQAGAHAEDVHGVDVTLRSPTRSGAWSETSEPVVRGARMSVCTAQTAIRNEHGRS